MKQTLKTVRWGMIGCGDVTEVKSGPALQKARNSSLVAVMRRNADKAEDYAGRHGVPRWYANADALILDPEVDAVYIATPPSTHMPYTLAVARAGKPVYVEKPMARNHDECRAMLRACEEAGVPLFTAYYRRAMPRFEKVRELVASGAIGAIRSVQVTLRQPASLEDMDRDNLPWRVVPEISGGGRFVDLAAHTLDFLDHLLGPIVEVRGIASNQMGLYEAEDIVSAAFRFGSGVHGVGLWCFTAPDSVDLCEITGSAGRILFSSFDETPLVWETAAGPKEFEIPYPEHVQQPLIQTVVDALTGTGVCPSTGESGARTSWVMDQMLSSWRGKQAAG